MDNNEKHSLLGNGYYLDLVNQFGLIVLRRDDGTEVANFSVWEATGHAIDRAAREDWRTNQKAEGAGRVR
jgi:hypothetical protein